MGCKSFQVVAGATAVTVSYLSKFSSGLLLLHPPMSYEVVEHFTCTHRRESVTSNAPCRRVRDQTPD